MPLSKEMDQIFAVNVYDMIPIPHKKPVIILK